MISSYLKKVKTTNKRVKLIMAKGASSAKKSNFFMVSRFLVVYRYGLSEFAL
jgi:hypothetical protein